MIHSRKERRYKCKTCGRTFSETHGTVLYGVKKPAALFGIVVTLLTRGCPPQAIVAAYGLNWRTIRSWLVRAGSHSQRVHEAVIGSQQFDLGQVQVDEIKVGTQGGSWWMAMAVMVSPRLWLGGVVGPTRDRALISTLVARCVRWPSVGPCCSPSTACPAT